MPSSQAAVARRAGEQAWSVNERTAGRLSAEPPRGAGPEGGPALGSTLTVGKGDTFQSWFLGGILRFMAASP